MNTKNNIEQQQEDSQRAAKLWQSMKPHERLESFAKEREKDPYAKGKMSMSFPDIRAIKHFNGFILVIVDEKQALERSMKAVANGMGPDASPVEIMKQAQKRAIKTTALPLKTFINNVRYLADMTTHSQFYTTLAANKKSELHNVFEDALAAIKEAKKYRHHHPDEFRIENIHDGDARFACGECPVRPKDFALVFGHNWKSKLGSDMVDLLDINIYEDTDSLVLH